MSDLDERTRLAGRSMFEMLRFKLGGRFKGIPVVIFSSLSGEINCIAPSR